MPAIYANKYKFMTVDERDPNLDKPIERWYDIVIHPLSSFRKWWDLTILALVLWTMIVLPVRLAFFWSQGAANTLGRSQELAWTVIDIIIDFFFIADIVANFNTGYLQSLEQVLVVDRKRIAVNYLKGWFFSDLISSVPLDLILLSSSANSRGQVQRLPKVLRIIRLSKLLRRARRQPRRSSVMSTTGLTSAPLACAPCAATAALATSSDVSSVV